MPSELSEEHRKKLDSIVQQMVAAKEPDANVQFVVDDFKKKYAGQKQPGFMQKALGFGVNALAGMTKTAPITGALKGAAHTATNLADIGNMAAGDFSKQPGREKIDKAITPTKEEKPWYMGEQFAEFFIPGPAGKIKAAANAPRWIKALVGAGREALDIGMKTFAQTKDPMASLKAAGIGGAVGAASGALSGATAFKGVKSRLSPKETASVGEVQARGVPVSAGDVTGNKVLKAGEQKLGYVPGAIGPMAEHQAAKVAKGTEALEKIPGQMPGRVASRTEAGAQVESGVRGRITTLKKKADEFYDKARAELEKVRKTVQTGTKKSSVLDARGNPVETPIMGTVEAPVPMAPIRSGLKPYYDELTGRLPETMRANSPGYAVLKKIVEGTEETVDALALDKDLSTAKAFLRRYGGGIKDKSGRYAAAVVGQLEKGVEQSIEKVSPDALTALKAGRNAVRQYYAADELLSRLLPKNASPSVIYDRLTTASGRMLPDLKELNRIAPAEVQTVAKTYMRGLVDDITANGRLEKLGMGLKKLRGLQPEVRDLLFGKAQAEKIDNFLQGLRDIGADTNPSGTGKWAAIAEAIGVATGMVGSVFAGHPGAAAATAGAASTQMVIANRLAHLMTTPKGIARLTAAVKLPQGSKGFTKSLEAIGALASEPEAQQPPQ